jgi:hypothetical protein
MEPYAIIYKYHKQILVLQEVLKVLKIWLFFHVARLAMNRIIKYINTLDGPIEEDYVFSPFFFKF